jgi:uncharacterized protein
VRVVIDTNILVSGLMSANNPPGKIVDALIQGVLTPVFSQTTFAELQDVLQRPQLQRYFVRIEITPADFLATLREIAEFVVTEPCDIPIRDPKDRPFIELVATPPQPDFLINGDKDFEQQRYAGVPVISARLFLQPSRSG